MPGKTCPNCGNATFYKTPTGRLCSKCGHTMKTPANDGKGGRGNKCSNCNKYMVFNGVCRNCGARYK